MLLHVPFVAAFPFLGNRYNRLHKTSCMYGTTVSDNVYTHNLIITQIEKLYNGITYSYLHHGMKIMHFMMFLSYFALFGVCIVHLDQRCHVAFKTFLRRLLRLERIGDNYVPSHWNGSGT